MANKKGDYYLNNPSLPTSKAEFEYTPEMLKDIKKCEQNLLFFAENYFYIIDPDEGRTIIKLYKYQKDALRMLRDNRYNLLLASRQIGKALDVKTPIPTPNGWNTMGDLKDGDQVYAADGSICNVVKAHDVMHGRKCYKILFDNGEEIVADAEHLWFTQNRLERRDKQDGSIKTTVELLNTLKTYNDEPNHRIPTCITGTEDEQQERIKNKLPLNSSKHRAHWHYIKDIQEVDSVPVRCITVDSKDNLYLCGRQYIPTHNTTLLTIYALWIACFNEDQNIMIVANKESTAIEIFRRVRLAYEQLPNWLKPGVDEYGKTSMMLNNGSRIGISTTTGSAARGTSLNCVNGNSIITVRNKTTQEVENITIAELHQRLEKNTWKTNLVEDSPSLI